MKPEEQKAYEGYFDMFATHGWKLVKEQLAAEFENIKNEITFKAEGELNTGKLRGKAEFINRLLGLEGQIETLFNQAKQEDVEKTDGDTV